MPIKTHPLEPAKSGQTLFLGAGVKYKSIIFSIAAILLALGVTIFDKYMKANEVALQTPKPNLESIVSLIRQFQRKKGTLPNQWEDLYEAGLWKTPPQTDNRNRKGYLLSTFGFQNYLYVYSRVQPDLATLWLIPQGPRKKESKSFFVSLGPQTLRYWAGPPEIIDPDPLPEISTLNALGFIEGTVQNQKKK